ncbi:MAG TPA: 3-dehydroquinate synthase [Steroidobacteraceae bacterium]|nr:3-dehydroquinate synthase [Steroidobacteraceae bacterium]
MQTLSVNLGERAYPILIGSGLLGSPTLLASHIASAELLLVSNTTVAPLYAERVKRSLPGRRLIELILPDGEAHKTLANASRMFDVMIANRLGRDAAILALGGGVIGDLAGFVAACYQRGIDFVQLPSTLLADVDASVGGKTAVNHPGGKNMIGAFHQPRAVIIDTDLLASLPQRELRAGLAEVIKYGLISDASFFDWIEAHIDELLSREPGALSYAIHRSCEIKAQIVSQDEREQGERALLNLGHTFGHAIEAATGYAEWLHGEAVAVGLVLAADLSQRLGQLPESELRRLVALLRRAGLPVAAPPIGAERAFDFMRIDKKVKSSRVRLVLLRGIGGAVMTGEYSDAALHSTLAAYFGRASAAAR